MDSSSDADKNSSDSSNTVPDVPQIVYYTLNETIEITGAEIINQQGAAQDGTEITHTTFTTFNTTDPDSDVQITENLVETVTTYDDVADNALIAEIQLYASQIQCSNFHGKGSIDDYSELFVAASKIANESKQMQLDIDIDGFNEFGKAADDLSNLFNSFIVKLQNVSVINDTAFLTSIAIALKQIVNLSNVFGKFKETIIATSTVQMPKTAHTTAVILRGVMTEINCAMNYINNFVNPVDPALEGAALSAEEQTIISTAVHTIESWNTLCEHGVSISLQNNDDVQYITQASSELKHTTVVLHTAVSTLRAKLANYIKV